MEQLTEDGKIIREALMADLIDYTVEDRDGGVVIMDDLPMLSEKDLNALGKYIRGRMNEQR